MLCSGGEEAEADTAAVIYKKNSASGPAAVDTMAPGVDTEMVKLNDTQPEATEDATDVSCIHMNRCC